METVELGPNSLFGNEPRQDFKPARPAKDKAHQIRALTWKNKGLLDPSMYLLQWCGFAVARLNKTTVQPVLKMVY